MGQDIKKNNVSEDFAKRDACERYSATQFSMCFKWTQVANMVQYAPMHVNLLFASG